MLDRRQLILAAGLGSAGLARAQGWPARPIALITNSAAGGSGDMVARLIAIALKDRIGPIVVENRPGANSTIAVNAAARAAPDGYTMVLTGPGSQLPVFSRVNGIDVGKTMVPVAGVYSAPFYVYVRSSLGVNTLAELAAYSQKNDLKMGLSAASSELAIAMLKSKMPKDVALQYRVIPYKSDVAITTAFLGGEVDFCFSAAGAFMPHLKSGTVKPLLTSAGKRVPSFPDVPTATEAGVRDFVFAADQSLWMPAGTPPDIIRRLQPELMAMARNPEFIEKMNFVGFVAYPATAEQQLHDYNERVAFWQDAARITGYQPQ